MGFILSKFRSKPPSSKERLEDIDKELRKIQRFQFDTELQQKKIIGKLILVSSVLYLLGAAGAYLFSPENLSWKGRALYILPFIVFPLILWLLKRVVTMFYQRRIAKKKESYDELKKEKQRILEDVIENESFKVAKEILEKYAPGKLLPKHMEQYASMPNLSPMASPSGPFSTGRGTGAGATPLQSGANPSLRRRTMAAQFQPSAISTPMRSLQQGPGYIDMPFRRDIRGPRFGSQQFNRQPTNTINRPVLAITDAPSPYSPMSVRFRSAQPPPPQFMLPLPPSNPVMQNRSMGWMDKLVEYVVGDGPSNRYALICRYCATHNGLATQEEFPYIGFRCVYCKQYNAPKQVRPAAPKLPTNTVLIEELDSTMKSEVQPTTNVSDSETDNDTSKKLGPELDGQPEVTEVEGDQDGSTEFEEKKNDHLSDSAVPSVQDDKEDTAELEASSAKSDDFEVIDSDLETTQAINTPETGSVSASVTVELLRKRVEHNEGEIHSVEELALHQEKIEKIEHVDKWCKKLKILYLQNNLISKIENVGRLKQLEYLNLALNNIERIENLEGCESLNKLDLTLNFIGEITSVMNLRQNLELESLYLTGNPCAEFPGYRKYVIHALPNLKSLDGEDITPTERLIARQELEDLEEDILASQNDYLAQREMDKRKYLQEHSEDLEVICTDADDYWNTVTPNTPEVRRELTLQAMKLEEKSKQAKESAQEKPKETKQIDLFYPDGRPKNINQPKVSFNLQDDYRNDQLILDVSLPKYMDTSLVQADVEPTHVKLVIKGKIFQMVLPEEVKSDSALAQRSKTTGHLVLTMPKVKEAKFGERDTQSTTDYVIPASKRLGASNTAEQQVLFKHSSTSSQCSYRDIIRKDTGPSVGESIYTQGWLHPKPIEKGAQKDEEDFVDNPEVWPLI